MAASRISMIWRRVDGRGKEKLLSGSRGVTSLASTGFGVAHGVARRMSAGAQRLRGLRTDGMGVGGKKFNFAQLARFTRKELDQGMGLHHFHAVTRSFIRLLLAVVLMAAAPAGFAADPEKSVVQIMNFAQQPMWDAPWRFASVQRSSGTGFVIKGKRIMTNAHVVSWARQLLVKRHQDPHPYQAKVVFIGHDCDLALLEVEDEAFFSGLEPLEFGELPKVRSTVTTYGYPAGGEQISYTKGVVSRVEMQTYVHVGSRAFLGVQTDAAINPGNSGGPVIQDDRVVGVAFQGVQGLENTGFFIPQPVIAHFLKDVEDGKYDGFPQLGIRMMPLQNPAYRRKLKLPENDVGARIDNVSPYPTTQKVLKEDDVLLQIGSYAVGSDATIMYEGNRLQMAVAFQSAQNGDTVPVKVWRDGKEENLSLPVLVHDDDRKNGNQYDQLPRYYVYAGLIFTPLSLDYLKTFGRNWSDSASAELIFELMYHKAEDPATVRAEPIVLAGILSDAVNANFHVQGRAMVDKINGVRIEKLEDVIRGFAAGKGPEHVIEFLPKGAFECLERTEADQASDKILKTYGVPKDRRL